MPPKSLPTREIAVEASIAPVAALGLPEPSVEPSRLPLFDTVATTNLPFVENFTHDAPPITLNATGIESTPEGTPEPWTMFIDLGGGSSSPVLSITPEPILVSM